MKEPMRMHPGVCMVKCRVVAAGGASICGATVLAGKIVALSELVTHRDRAIFGDSTSDCFRRQNPLVCWCLTNAFAKEEPTCSRVNIASGIRVSHRSVAQSYQPGTK